MKAFRRRLAPHVGMWGTNGAVFTTILILLFMGGVFIYISESFMFVHESREFQLPKPCLFLNDVLTAAAHEFTTSVIRPAKALENGEVIINELMWMGSSASLADEWIELRNMTEESLDISGWELTKLTSGNETLMLTLPGGSILEAQGYFLIANYDENSLNTVLGVAPDHVDSKVSLSNSSLEIRLYNGPFGSSELIDQAGDGGSPLSGNYSSGLVWESMERNHTPDDGSQEISWHPATFALGFGEDVPDLGTARHENSENPNHSPVAEAGPDQAVIVGETVYFDGSDSFDPDDNPLDYEWDFGDGSQEQGITPTHSFASPGIYEVWLTVSDGEIEAKDNLFVTVSPPSSYYSHVIINELLPNPSGDETENEWIELKNIGNEEINLENWILADVSRSYTISASDFDSVTVESGGFILIRRSVSGLALNNYGGETLSLYQPDENLLGSISYVDSAPEDQSYAREPNGDFYWTTSLTPDNENIFTFLNQPPEAEAGQNREIRIGEIVEFDGSDSYDPDGDPLEYFWNFGDDDEAEGVSVSHTYYEAGMYLVSLIVADQEYIVEDSLEVTVLEREGGEIYAEDIIINEIYPNPEGVESEEEFIELKNSGSESIDLAGWKVEDASGRSYVIDPGDFENSILTPGGYFVVFREISKIALNNSGEEKVNLYQPNGELLDSVNYSGSASEGKAYALIDEEWFWTEEVTPGEENKYYSSNEPPSAEIETEGQGKINMTITFDGSESSDDQDDLEFFWDFGDGEKGEGMILEHAYQESGEYKVVLKVIDIEGLEDEAEVIVTISDYDYSDLIFINEILPSPEGSDKEEEWIELINLDTRDIDLEGWVLTDQKTYFQLKGEAIIETGSYLVLGREETGIALNNSGDSLLLINPKGKVVNGVEYRKSAVGLSYSRILGTDNWVWTETITPGEENQTDEGVVLGLGDESKKSSKKNVKEVIQTLISKLKELALKTLVEVTGYVSVEPDTFGKNYFYIYDGEAGIRIYSYKKEFPDFSIGQKVKISGTLSEAQGERKINTGKKEDIMILEKESELPQPMEVNTLSENLVGALVAIKGIVLNIEGRNVLLETENGGTVKVYLKLSADIDKKLFQEGESVKVTGIVSKNKEDLMILSRSNDDIEKLGKVLGESVVQEEIEIESNDQQNTVRNYLIGLAVALGIVLIGFGVKYWREKKDRKKKKKS